MTTRDEWAALAERCENATGPDRDIDCEIIVASFGGEIVWKTANYTMEQYPAHRIASRSYIGGFANEHVPALTASLDAITALIERELPAAWVWTLGQNIHHRAWGVSINNLNDDGEPYSVCWGASKASPALALCAAFCRAKAAQKLEGGK